jgi:hypothetical protein
VTATQEISHLPEEDLDRKHVALVVRLHLTDRTYQAPMLALFINADEVECLTCMKVAALALGVPEVGFLQRFDHYYS